MRQKSLRQNTTADPTLMASAQVARVHAGEYCLTQTICRAFSCLYRSRWGSLGRWGDRRPQVLALLCDGGGNVQSLFRPGQPFAQDHQRPQRARMIGLSPPMFFQQLQGNWTVDADTVEQVGTEQGLRPFVERPAQPCAQGH